MVKISVTIILSLLTLSLYALDSPQEYNNKIEQTWGGPGRDDACNLAAAGTKKYPDNAELLGRLGYCMKLQQKGDYGTQLLEKAFAMDPNHPFIKIWIEDAYLAYGWKNYSDTEKCVSLWKRAMEINPGNREYLYQIGNAYSNSNKFAQAIAWYDRAIEKGYEDDSVYAWRGNAFYNLNKFDEAKKDLDKSLSLNPVNAWALYVYGFMYNYLKDLENSAAMLDRFLALKDSDFAKQHEVSVKKHLAGTLINAGLFNRGKKYLESLLAKYPGNPDSATWEEDLFFVGDKKATVSYEVAVTAQSVRIMLPVQTVYQAHLKYRFIPEPAKKTIFTRSGNTMADLYYAKAPKTIKVSVEMILKSASIQEGGFLYNDPDDDPATHTVRYIDSAVEINPDDPELKSLADMITGIEKDPLAKAKLIHDWISKNFTYKVVFHKSIKDYLAAKEAECGGHALVFEALARAAGIPSRRVFSPLLEFPDSKTFGSHETSEFFVEGKGWIPVNNTAYIFGTTSKVISMWRNFPDNIDQTILYPELKSIRVEYEKPRGKKVVLQGG